MILEASYEATFYAALINYTKTGNPNIFLTLLGGGSFGNKREWIFDAIKNAVKKFKNTPLNITIVGYLHSSEYVKNFIEKIKEII